jgi:hypothetical protein
VDDKWQIESSDPFGPTRRLVLDKGLVKGPSVHFSSHCMEQACDMKLTTQKIHATIFVMFLALRIGFPVCPATNAHCIVPSKPSTMTGLEQHFGYAVLAT